MKIKRNRNMYCKYCKRHTAHKVSQVKGHERGSLKHGSISRARKRGLGRGYGNLGIYGSKGAMSGWKRYGAKSSKKTNLKFKCTICNKEQPQSSGFRTKKVELIGE